MEPLQIDKLSNLGDEDKHIKLNPWNENNRLLTIDDVYYIYERSGFKNVEKLLKSTI